MWFLFGFVTLGIACASSFAWRRIASWSGESGVEEGVPFEYSVYTGKRRVVGANVGVACADGFTFSLRHESSFDRWSRKIGLVRECQTGDADFDRAFYILSDDPAVHRMLQTDEQLRTSIEHVFSDCAKGLGAPKTMYVHGGRVWITAAPRAAKRDAAAKDCRAVVPALQALGARLTRDGVGLKDDRDPFPLRAAAILAISTGLAINAGFELFRMATGGNFPTLADGAAPLPLALAAGIALILAIAAIAVRVMGHSARTHLVLLELLIFGTVGATVSAYAELRDYDFEYDAGPARIVTAHVAERYTTTRKHTTHYHVRFVDWPALGQSFSLDVSRSFYDRVSFGDRFDVDEHPGALGWPWASGFGPEAQPE